MDNPIEPVLLEYERPVSGRGVRVRTDEGDVHIDAGPMSNRAFASAIAVASTVAILSSCLVLIFAMMIMRLNGPALLTVAFLTIAFWGAKIALVAMKRHEHQKCGVIDQIIYFSNATTRGVQVHLDSMVTWKIVPRRHLLMPWLWRVMAKPPVLMFRLSSQNCPTKCNLLIGLDRETSTELARTMTGSLAVSNSSRPGGFEVIVAKK